jgi:hypothetical protein
MPKTPEVTPAAESYQDEQDGGVAYGDICKIKCNSNHGDT